MGSNVSGLPSQWSLPDYCWQGDQANGLPLGEQKTPWVETTYTAVGGHVHEILPDKFANVLALCSKEK